MKQNKPKKVRATDPLSLLTIIVCFSVLLYYFFAACGKYYNLLINQPNQKNQNQQANISSLSFLFLRFGFKIVGQNTENKKDRIREQLYRIIIRAFIIHTKRFTLQLLLYISQFHRSPARSTRYQVPKPLMIVMAHLRILSALPAARAHQEVRIALRVLCPLPRGAPFSLGRCHHQSRTYCATKKDRSHIRHLV